MAYFRLGFVHFCMLKLQSKKKTKNKLKFDQISKLVEAAALN